MIEFTPAWTRWRILLLRSRESIRRYMWFVSTTKRNKSNKYSTNILSVTKGFLMRVWNSSTLIERALSFLMLAECSLPTSITFHRIKFRLRRYMLMYRSLENQREDLRITRKLFLISKSLLFLIKMMKIRMTMDCQVWIQI